MAKYQYRKVRAKAAIVRRYGATDREIKLYEIGYDKGYSQAVKDAQALAKGYRDGKVNIG